MSYLIIRFTSYKLLLTILLSVIIFTDSSKADPVIDWNATAVTVQGRVPAQSGGLVDLAYLHIAIYDAVNAIDANHPIFAIDPPNKVPWANLQAAVHSAARRILMTFYSADSVFIDSVYQARMSLIPNDSTKTKGAEIGNTTATMYLSYRTGDGRLANIPYVWQPLAPGVYQPTPPGSPQYTPVAPWQAQLLPFSFNSPSQYRAPAPPLLTSAEYTADFNEVKMYGSSDFTNTTPEMREIAFFHTENPGIHVPRNIRDFAASQNLSLIDNARFFVQIYVSIGDALISGWNSKYYYNRWRPSTAIRNADIDGNPATDQDTLWLPLAVTPRHPEYVAAHGVVSGAIAYTINNFFATPNITITLTSTVTGTQHTFTNIYDYLDEITNARIWGGMHFRTSCQQGVQIGQDVANYVANLFVPVELISLNSMINGSDITLTWITATEINNQGFEIYRNGNKIAFVEGKGTTTETQNYSFTDKNLESGIYNYRLNQIDFDGTQEVVGELTVYLTLPEEFSLEQNFPNPFNPSTVIGYQLPVTGFVSLKIYDVLGNEVATLVNEEKPAGSYEVEFNSHSDGGQNLPAGRPGLSSGIYLYKLQVGNFIETKKMLLLK
ncbi:MAG: T9SS C-terminal target domain-containing protein [Ignavibacteriae bacterium]|jgi:hypothetical protein|nr:MAG: T9SS C-terminal target domain-containing protein [Chlorobiota bacterium]MBL1122100.1 T9SS C-terminal target domain-containing protein [Ignavibacteriota bacterium]MCE7856731.1 T9SS C-terminal target domain-containing protein [Ignavibacteria bacterium CHB3]